MVSPNIGEREHGEGVYRDGYQHGVAHFSGTRGADENTIKLEAPD